MSTPPTELAVGGRYRLERELGRGSAGRVLLATDLACDEPRALKVVSNSASASLQWELEVLSELKHPAIAGVFELLRLDVSIGAPFYLPQGSAILVEEFIDGLPAATWVDRNAPGELGRVRDVVHLGYQLCRAVGHLHASGLLHGDIKPDNMRVRDPGHLVLLDLGLSGAAISDGRVRGTPGFIAPEGWAGVRNVPTDLFAIGATMHALLSDATNGAWAPRVDLLPEQTPAPLRSILRELLSAKPEGRPGAAREVAAALAAAGVELGLELETVDERPTGLEEAFRIAALPLTGRQPELESVLAGLEAEALVSVTGAPGAGKSRLIAEAVLSLQQRCRDRGASVPTYLRVPAAWTLTNLAELPAHDAILHLEFHEAESGTSVPAAIVPDAIVLGLLDARQSAAIRGFRLHIVLETVEPLHVGDHGVTVELGPLADAELTELTRLAIGKCGPRRLEVVRGISGGLPGLLVRPLCEAFRSGADPRQATTLARLRAERVETFPPSTRDLVERLAVAGGALGSGALPAGAAEAAAILRNRGVARFDANGRLRLRAGIARDVYRGLPPSRRKAIAAGKADGKAKSELTWSGLEGADPLAAPYCAAARGEDAVALFEEVVHRELAAGQTLAAEAVAVDGIDRTGAESLRLILAAMRRADGRYEAALATIDALPGQSAALLRAELARRSGDRERAEAEWRQLGAPAGALGAWLRFDAGEFDAALELAAGQSPEEVEVRAWVHLAQGNAPRATELLRGVAQPLTLPLSARSRASVAQRREARSVARLHSSLGSALKAQGHLLEASKAYQYALELAEELGERHLAAGVQANLAAIALDRGELGAGIERARAAAATLANMGRPRDSARALNNLVVGSILAGDFVRARGLLPLAKETAERAGDADAQAYVSLAAAELHAVAGRMAEARKAAVQARELSTGAARRFVSARSAALLCASFPDLVEWVEASDASVEAQLARGRIALSQRKAPDSIPAGDTWDEQLRAAFLAIDGADVAGIDAGSARSKARSLLDFAARGLDHAARRRLFVHPGYQRALPALPESNQGVEAGRWQQLANVAKTLTAERRLDRLYGEIVDAAIQLVGAERGFLIRRSGGDFDVLAERGAGAARSFSRNVVARALDSQRVLAAMDAMSDERLAGASSVHAMALRSVLCAPLPQLGMALYVDDRVRPAAFDEIDTRLLTDLADLCTIALDGAMRLRAEREAVRRLQRARRKLAEQVDRQREEIDALRREQPDIVARSATMRRVVELVQRSARSAAPVLLIGESGVGKERLAHLVHETSPRAARPFVVQSCGAASDTLLESLLFGHVRGAFTGADRRRVGLFEAAHGGTLFLDEVGEMTSAMQAKLLRAVQEGEVRPVGSDRVRRVNVRIVAATHRDLRAMVDAGDFREDLYYRLAVVQVHVPPLRERREDIPVLAAHFLKEHAPQATLSPTALELLVHAPWPGNIRQLENEIRRAAVVAEGHIDASHLTLGSAASAAGGLDLRSQIDQLETRMIRSALSQTGGNQTQAAKLLGVSRYGLQKMIKRLQIASKSA